MRKASIDIGTNSTRLLLADVNSEIVPVLYRERMTRLGEGLNRDGYLKPKAIERVVEALKAYKTLGEKYGVQAYSVFATSAARDSKNQAAFVRHIKRSVGLDCEIISGEREAFLSFKGASSDLDSTQNILVCDIGGGSTEFIAGDGMHLNYTKSLNIGSRRLTERFFRHDPVLPAEIEAAAACIRGQLLSLERLKIKQLVSVGGTATTLAMIREGISVKDAGQAHHTVLKQVNTLVEELGALQQAKRKKRTGLRPERADVIVMGALILENVLDYFNLDRTIVSMRDLLFGALLQ
ncbi:Ppx/GppA family phosphatase [candidate division KSB1 bacterium]|nr:Ppx/GppA family phosphatase [candidate division KSB1 bacterium]